MRFITAVWVVLVAVCTLAPLPLASAGTGKTVIVAIDPGHGGKDQGAVGPGGIQEKDIVLQLARRLASLVNSQRGMRAVLTRRGDQFLYLQERINVARRHKADLFVSIHADAFTNPDSGGSSVFVLSTRGASSAAAHWLAKRENAADSPAVASLNIKDETVRAVVFDMYHDAILTDSMALAAQVLAQLGQVGRLHTGMVERAGFVVLKAPDIPSILVEAGFISNPAEGARLRNGKQQQRLAEAILRGIRAYLKNQVSAYQMVAVIPSARQSPTATRAVRASAAATVQRSAEQQPTATTHTKATAQPTVESKSRSAPATAPSRTVKPQPPSARSVTVKASKPAVSKTPLAQPAGSTRQPSSKTTGRRHVVKPGETLADIAKRYRISLVNLRSANGLDSSPSERLPVGKSLTIPAGGDNG